MCGAKKKAQAAIAAANQTAAAAVADANAARQQLAAATTATTQVAAYDNTEAFAQSDIEARLRRRRAGAAANVLTGPTGIPATPTLGGVAA
jgi:hypothetical protein